MYKYFCDSPEFTNLPAGKVRADAVQKEILNDLTIAVTTLSNDNRLVIAMNESMKLTDTQLEGIKDVLRAKDGIFVNDLPEIWVGSKHAERLVHEYLVTHDPLVKSGAAEVIGIGNAGGTCKTQCPAFFNSQSNKVFVFAFGRSAGQLLGLPG